MVLLTTNQLSLVTIILFIPGNGLGGVTGFFESPPPTVGELDVSLHITDGILCKVKKTIKLVHVLVIKVVAQETSSTGSEIKSLCSSEN